MGHLGPATPARGLRLHPAQDLVGILAAHRIPYAATATVAHPVDLVEKARKARTVRGTRFLHVLAPCPPQWGCAASETIDLARAAVRNRVFPLYEVEDGLRWRITAEHPGEPVEPYLARQERFRELSAAQIRLVQAERGRALGDPPAPRAARRLTFIIRASRAARTGDPHPGGRS